MNPGQVVDNLAVDVDINENSPITDIYIPELRTGNEIDALPTDARMTFYYNLNFVHADFANSVDD